MTSSQNNRRLIGAVGILAGGIIGAGVFSLPYVVSGVGLLAGGGLLFLATASYCYLHLMYADIITGTKGEHRFVGYIHQYLGRPASYAALLIAVVQMIFVLTIYLILSVSFIALVAPALSTEASLVLFWAVSSLTIFIRLKKLALLEMAATIGIAAIILLLLLFGLPQIGSLRGAVASEPLTLLPLAAIFFALSGRVAIPPLVRFIEQRTHERLHRRLLRCSIVFGTVLPAVVYAAFVVGVLALSGSGVSADAVSGLAGTLPSWFMILVGVLGLLALWSSYILVGLDVYDTLRFDFDLPTWLKLFLVVVTPPLLYFLGFTSFIGLVSFVGGICLAAEGALLLTLWRAARRQGSVGNLLRPSVSMQVFIGCMLLAALIGVVASR